MAGSRSMLIGFICAAAGIALAAVAYEIAPTKQYYVAAYGAALVGALKFAFGLFKFINHGVLEPKARKDMHGEATVEAIAQAMLATCVADGEIHDNEVESISRTFTQVFGYRLEADVIRAAAAKMLDDDFDIARVLGDELIIEAFLKPRILLAAYRVAMADGQIAPSETAVMGEIASALKMSEVEVSDVVAEIDATVG